MKSVPLTEHDEELLNGLRRLEGRLDLARSAKYLTDRSVAGETLGNFQWARDESTPNVYRTTYRFGFLESQFRVVVSNERRPLDMNNLDAPDFSQIDLHEDGVLVASGRMVRRIDENGIAFELHPHKLLFAAAPGRWTVLLTHTEKQMTAEAMEMLRRHTQK